MNVFITIISIILIVAMSANSAFAIRNKDVSGNEEISSKEVLINKDSFNFLQILRASVDKDIFSQINVEVMRVLRFVPIAIKDKYLFIAIDSYDYIYAVADICKRIYGYEVKCMLLPDDNMLDLLIDLANEAEN